MRSFTSWSRSKGLTIKDICDKTGLDKKTISRLRKAEYDNSIKIRKSTIEKIENAYGVEF